MKLSLSAIAAYLDRYLGSARFANDQNGIYRASNRPVKRIGLALEPWVGIDAWIRQECLDALFLHRPWQMHMQTLPAHVGVLAYHLAFHLTLTFGFNQRLANVLQIKNSVPFAFKEVIPYGMIGDIDPDTMNSVIAYLAEIFGIIPSIEGKCVESVHRIAIVGAMTDSLVRRAASQGVQLYITGQMRQSAKDAAHEVGMTVAEIGHAAGEAWGMRALAGLLQERWAQLEVVVASPGASRTQDSLQQCRAGQQM